MPRPLVHDEQLRLRLLEIASAQVAAVGPDGLSMRSLATAAKTSTTAVYSLFGGRRQLLDSVVAEGFRRFAEHLRAVPVSNRPEADIADLGRAYRRSALDDPHFYRVLFSPAGTIATTVGDSGTFDTLVAAAQRCIDAGLLRTDDATAVAHTLWALVHGLVSLELAGLLAGNETVRAAVFDHALGDIWVGLARPM